MKKIISAILVAVVIITMATSCSTEQGGASSTATENSSNVNQDKKPEVRYADKGLVGYDIWVNARSNRRTDGVCDATVFHGNGKSMISVKPVTEEFSGTYKDIFAVLNTGKNLDDIDRGLVVSFDDDKEYPFTVESETDVEIKGMQCRKITGSMIDKADRKILGYGYTFIFENIPFMMMGYVFDESDDTVKQELIDEVEVMISSLRTEP